MDILGFIFGILFFIAFFVLAFYVFHSSLAKRVDELESDKKNLEIVNANLSKYNEMLIKQLKK